MKTATFFLSQIKSNSLEQNFDFALEAGKNTDNIVVSFVRVIRSAEHSGPVSSSQKTKEQKSEIEITYTLINGLISVNSQNNIRNIDLYDLSGKKVKTLIGKGNTYDLQTSGFKSGVYLLMICDIDGNIKRDKILIKNRN